MLSICMSCVVSSAGMSRRDRRAVERALRKGKKAFVHGRVIILGPGRAGKSALRRSLMNKEFKDKKSTVGFAIRRARCFVRTTTGKVVFKKDSAEMQSALLACKAVLELLEEEKSEVEHLPAADLSQQASSISTNATESDLSRTNAELSATVQEALSKFVDELCKAGAIDEDVLNSEACLDIWDFGGQRPFQAMGHVFLNNDRCCYIVVFDATKLNCNEYYQEIFCDSDGEDQPQESVSIPYEMAFENWLNMVHQIAGKESKAHLYAVGTHIDDFKLNDDELRRKTKELKAFILNLAKGKAYESILQPNIFFLTNKESGTADEHPDVEELRTKILECAASDFTVHVPLNWLPFTFINKYFADNSGLRILPVKTSYAIARLACRDPDVDISALLSYHEKLGQILRHGGPDDNSPFPEFDTDPVVVIDPEWLRIAAAVLFKPKSSNENCQYIDQVRQLFEKGILFESLAKHRWQEYDEKKKKNDTTLGLAMDDGKMSLVLRLLSQYGLLYDITAKDEPESHPAKDEPETHPAECRKFIVPFLVQKLPRVPSSAQRRCRTPSYYIVCKVGQLFPEISFWCIAVRLMQVYGLPSDQLDLYHAHARLRIANRFLLYLEHFSRGIRLQMEDEVNTDDLDSLASMSREALGQVLDTVKRLIKSTLPHMVVSQAVSCRCEVANKPCVTHAIKQCSELNCCHFAHLKKDVFRCPELNNDPAIVAKQDELRRFWFSTTCRMVS